MLHDEGGLKDEDIAVRLMQNATDGAPTMIGCNAGFQTIMRKRIAPWARRTHCGAHRVQLTVAVLQEHGIVVIAVELCDAVRCS